MPSGFILVQSFAEMEAALDRGLEGSDVNLFLLPGQTYALGRALAVSPSVSHASPAVFRGN